MNVQRTLTQRLRTQGFISRLYSRTNYIRRVRIRFLRLYMYRTPYISCHPRGYTADLLFCRGHHREPHSIPSFRGTGNARHTAQQNKSIGVTLLVPARALYVFPTGDLGWQRRFHPFTILLRE